MFNKDCVEGVEYVSWICDKCGTMDDVTHFHPSAEFHTKSRVCD